MRHDPAFVTATLQQRALYLDAGEHRVFAQYHAAADASGPAAVGVVLVPPFGWEAMCSHRPRRAWAQALADAGIPALRIDLPGSGDSSGGPGDGGQLDSWAAAVAASAAWLRTAAACSRVAVVGIGLGGIAACRAVATGAAIDELVLWNVPARGRGLIRELHAFSRFESPGIPELMLAGDPPVPPDTVVVGGYALSAATVAELRDLDLAAQDALVPAGMRVLLLSRDDLHPDAALVEALRATGADLTVAPGSGYGAMTAEPTESVPPGATIARVREWLGAGHPRAGGASQPVPVARETVELRVDGSPVRETPVAIDVDGCRVFGILTQPDGATADACVVLLNAGALTHTGPNRMWVEAARRWAARGIPSLRLDVEGIGDADGDARVYRDVGAFYLDGLVDQVRAALDDLVARGLPRRFVLLGLCSGAYWAFHGAIEDDRVIAAYLVNPRAVLWDRELETTRNVRKLRKLARPSMWRKLADPRRSTTSPRVVAAALARRLGDRARAVVARLTGRPRVLREPQSLERSFARLAASGTTCRFIFTGEEPLYDEFERDGTLARLRDSPGIALELVSPAPLTHTLRPVWCQQRVHAALDAALARDVGGD